MTCVNAVVGIITCGEKILVAERPKGKPYAGYWEFPGGKIESGETSQAALQRELYEELGIQVLKSLELFQHTHQYPDKKVRLHIRSVTSFRGDPVGKEEQKIKWISFSELIKLNILEGNRAIISRIEQSQVRAHESR